MGMAPGLEALKAGRVILDGTICGDDDKDDEDDDYRGRR